MKKVLLASAVALLAACTSNTSQTVKNEAVTPTSAYFVGEWECAMNGAAATTNKVKLSEDGKATYVGNVLLPAEKPKFNYILERSGTWSFENNALTYSFAKAKLTRSHSEEVQAELKTNKELKGVEKQYFSVLNKQVKKAGKTNITLGVSNVTTKAFSIEQKMDDAVRSGNCVKVL